MNMCGLPTRSFCWMVRMKRFLRQQQHMYSHTREIAFIWIGFGCICARLFNHSPIAERFFSVYENVHWVPHFFLFDIYSSVFYGVWNWNFYTSLRPDTLIHDTDQTEPNSGSIEHKFTISIENIFLYFRNRRKPKNIFSSEYTPRC